jgi:hypothetical protein
VDDSFDGRFTLSHKGVHFASTLYSLTGNGGVPIGFEEDELDTDLTKGITQEYQSTVSGGNAAGQAAPTGELAAGVIHNAQAQDPDIQTANGEEKTTCFQRATDSKELFDDPAPATESSPWRPASLPFTSFDTHYQFTDRWFRQITPLGIRNARSPGTNAIPKAPRLAHALGSQAPDIPGDSSRTLLLRHTVSLQAQPKAPDILSLRAYTEELLASLNAQDQAPDDPSKTLVSNSHLLSLRAYMEELSVSFNSQDQAPDDLHVQDRQCAPCIFVDCFHHGRPDLLRFTTKQNVSHLYLQLVSQDSARELFNHLMTLPYQGVSRIEFHMCCLWIPVVSQDVDCFYSAGLGSSWTFMVIHFNDQCGSTLFVYMYISFA